MILSITAVPDASLSEVPGDGVALNVTQVDPVMSGTLAVGPVVGLLVTQLDTTVTDTIAVGSTVELRITQQLPAIGSATAPPPEITIEVAVPGSFGSGKVHNVPFVGVGAGQTVSLPDAPTQQPMLIIQGLVESPANYAYSGATLMIPAGLVWDGAACLLIFSS